MSKGNWPVFVHQFYEHGLCIPSRTIYLDDDDNEVNQEFARNAIKGLHLLVKTNETAPINIILNSYGGDPYNGMAVYDAIRAVNSNVSIQVFGTAMSAGAFILQAADWRQMAPNSCLMIHYGTESLSNEHAVDADRWMQQRKKFINTFMEQVFLSRIQERHPDFTLKRVRRMMRFDTYFTAEQAVEYGLADEVLE